MRTVTALFLAVAVVLHATSGVTSLEDLEPISPNLPFDPSWVTGPVRDFYNLIDSFGPSASAHIVGGNEVEAHSLPYQVGLNISIGSRNGFCGGSLISNRWVLTAAHCADQVTGIVAIVGAHNIKENEPTARWIPVEEIHVHPDWFRMLVRNDIALLKLKNEVDLDSKYVKAIRLPKISQKNESFWKQEVTMSGWGKDSDKSTKISPVLRSVTSKVVTNFYCNFRYLFFVIKDTHICTSGWWAKGTCGGDSGGPLVIKESDGEKTLIGITSFGIAFGCEWSWPPAFTRVTSYLDWIHKVTGIEPRT